MALDPWRKARGKVVSGLDSATVLCVGDSLTIGCASTGAQMGNNARSGSYPVHLAAGFLSAPARADSWFGDGNAPGDSKTLAQYDSRITLGAGWQGSGFAWTAGHDSMTQTGGLTTVLGFNPGVEFDRIRIYTSRWAGSPEYTVNIGGAPIQTLDMDNGLAELGVIDVACALGANPVNIVATGDWGYIAGCSVYKSTVKQINVINAGWWGAFAGDWAADVNYYDPLQMIRKIAPDLSIVMLGGNDCLYATPPATFKANLSAVVDGAQQSGSVLLVGFTPVNPATVSAAVQQAYLGHIQDVAVAKRVDYLNLSARAGWTTYASAVANGYKDADGIHNTSAGYADIAAAILEVIDAQFAAPAADLSAGDWSPSAGSDLFAMLDESPASDADFIGTSSESTCELSSTLLTDPGVDTGHVFSYRLASTTGGFVVSLMQGATTIASWTHGPAGPATWERSLSPAQAATIVYPATLTLQIEATS